MQTVETHPGDAACEVEAIALMAIRKIAVDFAREYEPIDVSNFYLAVSKVLKDLSDDMGRSALIVLEKDFTGMTPGQCVDELAWVDECAVNGRTTDAGEKNGKR